MDLAGHHGRHEEREGGPREEQVDFAALNAKRGGDCAHDDEEPEQVPGLLVGDQGDDNPEQGAGGEHEHGRPYRHPAQPARGTTRTEAVETGLIAGADIPVHQAALASQTWPPGEIVRSRAARAAAVRLWNGTPLGPALASAWRLRATGFAIARARCAAAGRESRAGLPATTPGRGTAAVPLLPRAAVTRQAARPAWRAPSGIAACGTGPRLPPRWCGHCWRG
jgi:hypothetical protein